MNAIDRVLNNAIPVTESGCLIWMGGLSPTGYANGAPEGKNVRIHRWLYEKLNGDIGDLVLDHLCRVRCCINPSHLEPVTSRENVYRGVGPTAINLKKSHCKCGREFDVFIRRSSGAVVRRCSHCKAEIQKRYWATNKPRHKKKALPAAPSDSGEVKP